MKVLFSLRPFLSSYASLLIRLQPSRSSVLSLKNLVNKTCGFRQISCQRLMLAKAKKGAGGGKKPTAGKPTRSDITPEGPCSNTVCTGANIYNEGDDPPLKDDDQYPDWLWKLLDPINEPTPYEVTLDDKTYWRRMNKQRLRANNQQQKTGTFKR